jgi:hypothetical protein
VSDEDDVERKRRLRDARTVADAIVVLGDMIEGSKGAKRLLKMTGTCRVCGVRFDLRRYDASGKVVGANRTLRTCERHRWARKDDVLVDRTTPYAEDVAAQLFVATFPGPEGATLEAVAIAMGISRERVRQIEEKALRKLRAFGVRHFYGDPEEGEPAPRHDVRGGDADEGSEEEDGGAAPDPGEPVAPEPGADVGAWEEWLGEHLPDPDRE